MTETSNTTTDATDADLIAAVRAGDLAAYGDLFVRHRAAATRLARQLVPGPDADDLVSESFARVMTALQQGKGPDEFFRAYLLTSIRRLHIDRIRAGKRVRTTGDEADLDRAIEFVDPAEMKFEQQAAAEAFASLPERWQLVLWHLDVERQKPAQVAPLLGMTPNSVSALAYRAREGLRAAYLQGHLAPALDDDCRATTALLSQYVRQTLRGRDTAAVDAHLDGCTRCSGLHLELVEINGNLSGWLAPAVLGTAAAGYLGAAGSMAAAGTGAHATATLSGRIQALTTAGPLATGAVVAASALTVVGAVAGVLLMTGDDTPSAITTQPAADSPRPTPLPSDESQTSRAPRRTPTASAPTVAPSLPAPTRLPATVTEPTPTKTPTRLEPSRRPTPDPAPAPTTPTTPTTPTPQPTATSSPPTGIDYSVAVGFTDEPPALQRRVTVSISAPDQRADARLVTVRMTFGATFGPPTYRGGLSAGWTCDPPAVDQPLAAMTCSRSHAAGNLPPLELSIEGPNPYVEATVRADHNVDPAPGNDAVRAEAPPWAQP